MLMELITGLIVCLIIQAVMFIPAFIFKTDKLTDLSYALTFIILLVILLFLNTITVEKILLISMITLWAVRLASYLFMRIRKMKRDKRFDNIRENFLKFAGFWLLQGFTVFFIMSSSILFLSENNTITNIYSLIGLIIWLIGLSIETIADKQKYDFKTKNPKRFIKTGLWKYSRHPNYFGEILNWVGIYLFTVSTLTGNNTLVALLSPAYITFTLLFVSGIPILEKNADKKYKKNKEYKKYQKNTSLLIFWFPKS